MVLSSGGPDVFYSDLRSGSNYLNDTARIANASAKSWFIPVLKDNRSAILDAATGFKKQLSSLLEYIKSDHQSEALENMLEKAHEFRQSIPEKDAREGIYGEIYDLSLERQDLTQELSPRENISFSYRTLFPALIGAAITLNAKQVEENLEGVSLTETANPSFLDGSAPSLATPNLMAHMMNQEGLQGNESALLTYAERFKLNLDALINALKKEDYNKIQELMEDASSLQEHMRPKRTQDKIAERAPLIKNHFTGMDPG